VIEGTDDGIPIITILIADQEWSATIDTGFNGDLELPIELQGKLNDQAVGRVRSSLAGGRVIEEDAYSVQFPFDGQVFPAVATFVADSQLLIGTNLLRDHELQIRFVSHMVRLEREKTGHERRE
jgi:predicted aspartyl protease